MRSFASLLFAVAVTARHDRLIPPGLDGEALTSFKSQRFTSTCNFPFEILFLQDATSTFDDDLATIQSSPTMLQDIFNSVETKHPNSTFGLLSFRDKPLWPAGMNSDYCARLDLDFTNNLSQLQSAYAKLTAVGGGDRAESQLSALMEATRSGDLTWNANPEATRLILVLTDAPVHYEGDGMAETLGLRPFSGLYDHIAQPGQVCRTEDYPSVEYVARSAQVGGMYIAALVADESEDQLARRTWKWISTQLQQPEISVFDLSLNSHNLTAVVASVVSRLEKIECTYSAEDGENESTASVSTEQDESCSLVGEGDGSAIYDKQLTETVTCLRESNVSIVTNEDAHYIAAIYPLDPWFPIRYPKAVIFANDTDTVIKSVKCAFENKVNIIARSGGHSYASYGYGVDDDFILDLKFMSDYSLDNLTGIATVGPGLRLSPLAYNAYLDGDWMVPGGACTSVGLAGHATGGGYGYYTRAFGLVSDQIVGGSMVLGNGTEIAFNANENSDLLWAMQGGCAANFGILTQLKLQMIKAPKLATALTILYGPADLQKVLEGMNIMLHVAPPALGFSMVYDWQKTAIQSNYFGSYDEMMVVLQPFFDHVGRGIIIGTQGSFLQSYAALSILSVTDTEAPAMPTPRDGFLERRGNVSSRKVATLSDLNTSASFVPPRDYFKARSMIWDDIHPLDDDCIRTIVETTEHPTLTFGLAVEMWGPGTAVSDVAIDATAFPHRNVQYISHIYAKSVAPITQLDVDFLDQYYEKVIQCAAPQVYANYRDYELGEDTLDPISWTVTGNGENANEAYFGPNLERLKSVKSVYNPWNMFWFPQAIWG